MVVNAELGLPWKAVGFSTGNSKVNIKREWLQGANLDQRRVSRSQSIGEFTKRQVPSSFKQIKHGSGGLFRAFRLDVRDEPG